MLSLILPLACFGAHPLVSDDAGVQGASNWQLELNADRSVERYSHDKELIANYTLTYGLGEALDLALNLPWQRKETGDAQAIGRGLGDISVFMKWRLYEHVAFALALKPLLAFPSDDADKGLGSDRTQSGLARVASWGDDRFMLLANLSNLYANHRDGARKKIFGASTAVLIELLPGLRFAAELSTQGNPDLSSGKYPALANFGLIYSPNQRIDLDLGYRRGRNKAEVQYAAGAGLTLRW